MIAEEITAILSVKSGQWTKGFAAADASMTRFQAKTRTAGKAMAATGKSMTMGLTLPIVGLGALAVKAASDYESAFTGVRKTVELTEPEFQQLSDSIREMSKRMPQSAAEIAKVTEVAGQLGIKGVKPLTEFTETMIQLGDSTDLVASEAASQIARFSNIMGVSTKDMGGNATKLGSTLVDLGNNFAATESEIMSLASRMAGAGNQVGMTQADILGLSAAMADVGVNAEAGGTAMSQSMALINTAAAKGGKAVEGFANVAGMSADQFQKAWDENSAKVLQKFAAGLDDIKDAGGDVDSVLDGLGIKGRRQKDVWLRLAGANDKLSSSLDMAGKAWKEPTALAEEAAKRYETFESQLKIFKNQVTDVGIELGTALLPAMQSALTAAQPLIDVIKDLATWFKNLSPAAQGWIVKALAVAAATGPLLMIFGKMVAAVGAVGRAFMTMGRGVGSVIGFFRRMITGVTGTQAALIRQTAAANTATAANIRLAASANGAAAAQARLGVSGLRSGAKMRTAAKANAVLAASNAKVASSAKTATGATAGLGATAGRSSISMAGLATAVGGGAAAIGGWALAAGGASIAASGLVAYWAQNVDGADGLTSALQRSNGALDANVRSAAQKVAADNSMIKMAKGAGISEDLLTSAILNEGNARDQVAAKIDGMTASSGRAYRATVNGVTTMTSSEMTAGSLAAKMQTLTDQYDDTKRATDEAREAQRAHSEQMNRSANAIAGIAANQQFADSLRMVRQQIGMEGTAWRDVKGSLVQLMLTQARQKDAAVAASGEGTKGALEAEQAYGRQAVRMAALIPEANRGGAAFKALAESAGLSAQGLQVAVKSVAKKGVNAGEAYAKGVKAGAPKAAAATKALGDRVMGILKGQAPLTKAAAKRLGASTKSAGDGAKQSTPSVIASMQALIKRGQASLKAGAPKVKAGGKAAGKAAGDGAKQGVAASRPGFIASVNALTNSGKTALSGAGSGLNSAGQSAGVQGGQGLASGISSMAGAVIGAAQRIASAAASAMKSALKISSPSKVTMKIGRQTVQGLIKGLRKSKGGAVKVVRSMIRDIRSAFNKGFQKLRDRAKNVVSFIDGIRAQVRAFGSVAAFNPSGVAAMTREWEQATVSVDAAAAAVAAAEATGNHYKIAAAVTALSEAQAKAKTTADALASAQQSAGQQSRSGADVLADMRSRVEQAEKFATQIEQLRRKGLNKIAIKDIIGKGSGQGGAIAAGLLDNAGNVRDANRLQARIGRAGARVGDTGGLAEFGKTRGQAQAVIDTQVNINKGAVTLVLKGGTITKADKRELRQITQRAIRETLREMRQEARRKRK